MAKEVTGFIKLQIKGGAANPAPPVGPALGSKGLNIMDFCKQFNARTQDSAGKVLPVVITPLLNAGVILPWMANARDLAGGNRLVGKPDIGCYESPAQRATVIQVR